MKRLNEEQIAKINEINGTRKDRYEYLSEIASIIDASNVSIKYFDKAVKRLSVDATTTLNIDCKTIKGNMVITAIYIDDNENKQLEYYKMAKGSLKKIAEI